MDLSPCEDREEIGSTVSEIYASQKRGHGPGRSYSDLSDKLRKNSLRLLIAIWLSSINYAESTQYEDDGRTTSGYFQDPSIANINYYCYVWPLVVPL